MSDIWNTNPLRLDGSRVIDRRIYVDPGIHGKEQERLFARAWQWVAHESELPERGDYVTATIAGRAVVVVRGESGSINAFFNTCSHRGAMLAPRARGNCGGGFVCMYHGWCFSLSGKLRTVPLASAYGGHLAKELYDIPTIRLESFAGHVFVCLDPAARPLEEFLGEAAPYIQQFTGSHEALGRVRWLIKGNWKLWHDNFRDNYHPAYTHPLVGAGYSGVKVEGSNHELTPGHGMLSFPMQRSIRQLSSAIGKVTGEEIDLQDSALWQPPPAGVPAGSENRILAVFPNLDFQNHGGGALHNVLQVVRPMTVDTAMVEALVFGDRGESAEMRQWRLERSLDQQTSAGKISGDDAEAARRCSIGFSAVREVQWSNMDRGQAPGADGMKNDEYSLRSFYSEYKKYMGGSFAVGLDGATARPE